MAQRGFARVLAILGGQFRFGGRQGRNLGAHHGAVTAQQRQQIALFVIPRSAHVSIFVGRRERRGAAIAKVHDEERVLGRDITTAECGRKLDAVVDRGGLRHADVARMQVAVAIDDEASFGARPQDRELPRKLRGAGAGERRQQVRRHTVFRHGREFFEVGLGKSCELVRVARLQHLRRTRCARVKRRDLPCECLDRRNRHGVVPHEFVEHTIGRQPLHDDRDIHVPLLFVIADRREAQAGRRSPQRAGAEIDVVAQASIEAHLVAAERAACGQRREVDERHRLRLLEFVDAFAGDADD